MKKNSTAIPIDDGLQAEGKAFYKRIMSENAFDTGHDLERLSMAAKLLDEIASDEKIIVKEGRFIKDRFKQKRENPAVKSIRENRVIFCRIIRELSLDLEPADDSRPPRQY